MINKGNPNHDEKGRFTSSSQDKIRKLGFNDDKQVIKDLASHFDYDKTDKSVSEEDFVKNILKDDDFKRLYELRQKYLEDGALSESEMADYDYIVGKYRNYQKAKTSQQLGEEYKKAVEDWKHKGGSFMKAEQIYEEWLKARKREGKGE